MEKKEKLLNMINFSFSPSVIERLVLQTRKHQGLLGKGCYYTAKKILVIRVINVPGIYIMFPGKIHVKTISPSEAPVNILSASKMASIDTSRQPIVFTGHVLRRLDLSNMTHHRPLVRGKYYALISSELSGEKWLLSFTFLACFKEWQVHRLHACCR